MAAPRPRALVGVAVVLAILALFTWRTLAAQRAECEVCVAFRGQRNCASASAPSEREARESAQSTACGVMARDMDASIACGRAPPEAVRCRSR